MFLFKRSKKKAAASDVDGATGSLKENIRIIQKREEHLSECMHKELTLAKSYVEVDKRTTEAILALKKKKYYEKEIERLANTRFALEQQVLALEGASLNVETFKSLKSGAQTLSALHGKVDASSIEEAMDDVREQLDLANEISEAISQPFTTGAEEALSDELEELQQEILNERMLDDGLTLPHEKAAPSHVATTHSFPEVEKAPFTTTSPTHIDADEQAELEELRASMAN